MAASLALALVGGWYYFSERGEISREKYRTLAAIGELKAKQIGQWRKERLAETQRAGEDLLTNGAVKKFLSAPGDPGSHAELRETLKGEVTEYANVLLSDSDGNILFNAENTPQLMPATTKQAIRAALAVREAVLSDFFRSASGSVHIDVAMAVRDGEGRPLAVLVLRTHAIDHLFSLLMFWPTESPSTETVLAQREGEEVVFVNATRADIHAPTEQRFPMSLTSLPAVQAALGKQGEFEGRDYHGVPVMADLRPIPGSSWSLVSKVNREEILADARYRAGVVTLLVGLFLLLATSVVAYLYRKQQAGLFLALVLAERKQEEEVRQKILELERFNQMTVGREVRMIELKQEINALLKAAGQPEKYRIVEE